MSDDSDASTFASTWSPDPAASSHHVPHPAPPAPPAPPPPAPPRTTSRGRGPAPRRDARGGIFLAPPRPRPRAANHPEGPRGRPRPQRAPRTPRPVPRRRVRHRVEQLDGAVRQDVDAPREPRRRRDRAQSRGPKNRRGVLRALRDTSARVPGVVRSRDEPPRVAPVRTRGRREDGVVRALQRRGRGRARRGGRANPTGNQRRRKFVEFRRVGAFDAREFRTRSARRRRSTGAHHHPRLDHQRLDHQRTSFARVSAPSWASARSPRAPVSSPRRWRPFAASPSSSSRASATRTSPPGPSRRSRTGCAAPPLARSRC